MTLSELKNIWREHDFRPQKRLGQNFLVDNNIRDNILAGISLDTQSTVVEIGSGFGVMTFGLAAKCRKLYAIEKDRDICNMMGPLFREKGNIELMSGDIRELKISSFAPSGGKITLTGNIPYYITTPIIEKIVEERECITSAYLVIQDEYAERVVALPGSRDYGSLSCYVQFYTKPRRVFKISKNSFYPRPAVDSCFIELSILPSPSVEVKSKDVMFQIIHKAFSQRRKQVLNSLSHGRFLSLERGDWERILNMSGIGSSKRAEDISLADYARMSDVAVNDFLSRREVL